MVALPWRRVANNSLWQPWPIPIPSQGCFLVSANVCLDRICHELFLDWYPSATAAWWLQHTVQGQHWSTRLDQVVRYRSCVIALVEPRSRRARLFHFSNASKLPIARRDQPTT